MGVLQGVTEFLPVSSSGHLALLEQAFGIPPRLHFASALHLGTLGVVVWHYRGDIAEILKDVFKAPARYRKASSLSELLESAPGLRIALHVVVASVPTALIGLGIARIWQDMAASLWVVSALLLATAAILVATRYVGRGSKGQLTVGVAILVGIAQGLAAAPGISRSGATIGVALLFGVARPEAARFSFLLSIPAILGAVLLEAETLAGLTATELPGVVAGTAAAAGAGYVALLALLRWVEEGRLHWFACYLVPLAAFGLGWSLTHGT
jgi:undecaprenyl-diphosphatase